MGSVVFLPKFHHPLRSYAINHSLRGEFEMKKTILILTVATFALNAAPALAQTTWFGAQGSAVLPTGDLKDITTSGGGGAFHLDQTLSKCFQARIDAGWLQFSSREMGEDFTSKVRVIPARVGLNYLVGPFDGTRFYVGGMAGAYFRQASTNIAGAEDSNEDTFFGAAACAGLLIPVSAHGGMLEINASYDVWFDEKDADDNNLNMGLVRLGVGYRFNI